MRWCLTFIALIVLAAVPVTASASSKRVAILAAASCSRVTPELMEQLTSRGYVEGRNLVVDCIATGNALNRETEFISELIARRPDVLITTYTAATRTAQRLGWESRFHRRCSRSPTR